jgi:mRNA interferase RelE/StbE
MATVVLTDEAKEDLRDLDGSAQKVVVKALRKLEDNPSQSGAPLGKELATYRKLVVDDEYRTVYRVEADGTVCVVWVIGKRADEAVYDMARARLTALSDRQLAIRLADIIEAAKRL